MLNESKIIYEKEKEVTIKMTNYISSNHSNSKKKRKQDSYNNSERSPKSLQHSINESSISTTKSKKITLNKAKGSASTNTSF